MIHDAIADTFATKAYQGGLTYSGHPLACASAVASIGIFKEEGIIEHARHLGDDIVGPALADMATRHPSVGEVRGLGVFWAIELVRNRETREPLVPYNASGPAAAPMGEFAAACKARGLWPFTHFNRTHVVPPLTISDDEMREGLAIIDECLAVADGVRGLRRRPLLADAGTSTMPSATAASAASAATASPELPVDAGDVAFDGRNGDVELAGDRLVRLPRRDEPEHLAFTAAERLRRCRHRPVATAQRAAGHEVEDRLDHVARVAYERGRVRCRRARGGSRH